MDMQVIAPNDKSVRVTAKPRPFSTQVERRTVQAGGTIAELVNDAIPDERMRRYARARLDGYEILRENWTRIRPKPGHELTVTVAPAGGGGGKNPLRIVLQLAALAAAVLVPAAFPAAAAALGGLGGPLISLGIGIVSAPGGHVLVPPQARRRT